MEERIEALTREAGVINALVHYNGGKINVNGEERFAKWVTKILMKAKLPKKLGLLSFSGADLNYISSSLERQNQLKSHFKCHLPPFPIPLGEMKTNDDMREAWVELWRCIGPKNGKYGGAMPAGWGEEWEAEWKQFTGVTKATAVMALLREKNNKSKFHDFIFDRIRAIYCHHLGSDEQVDNYNFNCQAVPSPNLSSWTRDVDDEDEETEEEETEDVEEKEEEEKDTLRHLQMNNIYLFINL